MKKFSRGLTPGLLALSFIYSPNSFAADIQRIQLQKTAAELCRSFCPGPDSKVKKVQLVNDSQKYRLGFELDGVSYKCDLNMNPRDVTISDCKNGEDEPVEIDIEDYHHSYESFGLSGAP